MLCEPMQDYTDLRPLLTLRLHQTLKVLHTVKGEICNFSKPFDDSRLNIFVAEVVTLVKLLHRKLLKARFCRLCLSK